MKLPYFVAHMALKHRIKPILRALGLMLLITRLKYWRNYIRYFRQMQAFKAAHPQLPLPPAYMLYIAYGLNYENYLRDGEATASWLFEKFGPHLPAKGTILDWGCGPARITRHLPTYFKGWQVMGTDYDPATIQWCQNALPHIHFERNALHPPLPIPSASVHAAIGISIFTHLSAAAHEAWLLELARILAPGGMFFVTTQGGVFLEQMSSKEALAFKNNQLVIRATGPEGHKVYGAYHPEGFIRPFWERYFEVIEHLPGQVSHGKPIQDYWMLKRNLNE